MEAIEWRETSLGRFERDISSIEAPLVMNNAIAPGVRERITVIAGITFSHSFPDIVPRFRGTWLCLRYNHPSMATTIEAGKKVYSVPDEDDLSAWLARTFIVTTCNKDDKLPELGEGREATLYVMPKDNKAIIQCPHDRVDGIGMIHLLNNLMKAVAKPEPVHFGDEMRNMTPTVYLAANVTPPTLEEMNEVKESLQEFGKVKGLVGLVPLSYDASSKFQRRIVKLSKSDTDSIVKATH
jgi:hypothetical protein